MSKPTRKDSQEPRQDVHSDEGDGNTPKIKNVSPKSQPKGKGNWGTLGAVSQNTATYMVLMTLDIIKRVMGATETTNVRFTLLEW